MFFIRSTGVMKQMNGTCARVNGRLAGAASTRGLLVDVICKNMRLEITTVKQQIFVCDQFSEPQFSLVRKY